MKIVTKNEGKKTRENFFFPETHVFRKQKRWKKIVFKKCENTFFYKHTNIVTKNQGKKARNFFFQNTRISRPKNNGKKSS